MKNSSSFLIAVLIGFALGLLVGAKSCSSHTTTTRIDTLTVDRPVEVERVKTRTVYRVIAGDTVYVSADSLKSDSTNNFTAISDTLTMSDAARIAATFHYPSANFDIYYKPHQDTVYVRHEQEQSMLKGWSFGVGVGYGVAEVDGIARVKPYVGVNLQKTLIGW